MIFNRIPLPAAGGFDPVRDISYTGAYTAEEKTIDGVACWLLIFTGTGTLTVNKSGLTGDICVCGGGSGGQPGSYRDGGMGGNGGFVNNYSAQAIASGEIVIGAGGGAGAAGGATSYGSFSANGGLAGGSTSMFAVTVAGGSSGGLGCRNSMQRQAGQGTTTRPFSSAEMEPLGGGGGGGAYHDEYLGNYNTGGAGGTDGGNGGSGYASGGMYSGQSGGAGGNKGGGAGGSCTNSGAYGGSNADYYGAGGGGGAIYYDTSGDAVTTAGGAGYPGVVMIRIPK